VPLFLQKAARHWGFRGSFYRDSVHEVAFISLAEASQKKRGWRID